MHGLTREERLAGLASVGLLVSLLLPWYSKSYAATVHGRLQQTVANVSALGNFTLVEAAVMAIAGTVLVILCLRAERGFISLPGRDGTVLVVAGAWSLALVVFRAFDQPAADRPGATVGIAWGIFVALIAAGALTSAGMRTRRRSPPAFPARRQRSEPATEPLAGPSQSLQRSQRADPATAATEQLTPPPGDRLF